MFLKKRKFLKEREISICGLPIIRYGSRILPQEACREKYIRLFPKGLEHQFLDHIISLIPREHDYIFLLRGNGMGETYLLNFMLEELKEKYRFKNPCFVSHRAIYGEVMSMWSRIPFYHDARYGLLEWNTHLLRPTYRYKGRTFRVYHAPVKEARQFFSPEKTSIHHVDKIARFTGCSMRYLPPIISQEIRESALSKARATGLNLSHFIFFVPEALSTTSVTPTLWETLSAELTRMGYDIYVNAQYGVSSWGKATRLSLPEAYYLASLSKGIVSIRCGFAEILSLLDVPKHIIYTHYRLNNLTAQQVQQATCIKQYPGVNPASVTEYDSEVDPHIASHILNAFAI